MILHTVLIKWKPGTTRSDIERVMPDFRGLTAIDGVTDLTFGTVIPGKDQNFDFIMTVRLPNKEFLEQTYLRHPAHMRVVDGFGKLIGSALIVDAEL
jgi:hypothetical protein